MIEDGFPNGTGNDGRPRGSWHSEVPVIAIPLRLSVIRECFNRESISYAWIPIKSIWE